MSKIIYQPAATRGNTNIGWLNGYHSISAAHYYNASRLAFGPLKVLNDDTVQPGKGFGTHGHSNMEIISIPLAGAVRHKDSTGNETIIKAGDIQMMSAGTGIYHSEYNASDSEVANFLQIWITPDKQNLQPGYQQIRMHNHQLNALNLIVSPDGSNNSIVIHQQAWLYLGTFTQAEDLTYQLHQKGNGVYLFLIKGQLELCGQTLLAKDAVEIREVESIVAEVRENTEVFIIEVPM